MAQQVTLTTFEFLGVDIDLRNAAITMRYQLRDASGEVRVNRALVLRPTPDVPEGDPAPVAPENEYYMTAQEAGVLTALRRMVKRRAAAIINDPTLEETT